MLSTGETTPGMLLPGMQGCSLKDRRSGSPELWLDGGWEEHTKREWKLQKLLLLGNAQSVGGLDVFRGQTRMRAEVKEKVKP